MIGVQKRSPFLDWFDRTILELIRQFRWSFLPPLMVYFAAGLSGLTAIVGAFFVKDFLGLSVTFLAGLAFWAGLPWALKMPLGNLVDLIWRWKAWLIYLGASLIAASLLIMYSLIARPEDMTSIMSVEAWYVLSVLLSPMGYVIQDSVADAMSVEAVPRVDDDGEPLSEEASKALHTTMQTLGRIALIGGLVAVALVNIVMFENAEAMTIIEKEAIYRQIYLMALIIPALSISGVILGDRLNRRSQQLTTHSGSDERTEINIWYFIGGAGFVALAMIVGIANVAFSQEIVFCGSLAIVLFLMVQLVRTLERSKALALFGTAFVIFVFRAMPLPGAGATWFEIDVLGFDQQFLSVLTLVTSLLTLGGMIVLRPMMARKSISYIIVLLTVIGGVLALPNIGLYYGVHHWTASITGGIVDARFIAILDTAIESPLGQVAMIPMLAWIGRNAPANMKATFFAVMASFTNLALSASSLATKYLNQLFVVSREVRNPETGAVEISADYSTLGELLISVAAISFVVPLVAVWIAHRCWLSNDESKPQV